MENEIKDGYLNFDEYIRQGEPAQRERADAWRVAIGLQAVDGLKTSEYLLLVENNTLKNRYMMINPPEEWRMTESEQIQYKQGTSNTQAPYKYRTSTSVTNLNTDNKFQTDNEDIIELVRVIGTDELSIKQMMDLKGLKHRQSFIDVHLEPALKEKFVRRKYPDRPNHPRQKYLLTVKGLALLKELTNRADAIEQQ